MRKHGGTIAIAVLCLLQTSCCIYGKYQRPDLPVTDSLYAGIPETYRSDSVSMAAVSWRDFFFDSLLQTWIETGLENNTDLRVARLRVDQAQATLQVSRLAFVPSVSVSAEGSYVLNQSGQSGLGYAVAVPALDWELDIFGRLTNAKRGAQAALEKSRAYVQAVQTQLVATIANSYYTLLMLDEQLSISRRTLRNWEENVRTLSALKQAGKTNEAAVLLAKSNKLTVEGSILTLEKQIGEQENAVRALLGVVDFPTGRGGLSEQVFVNDSLSVGIPLDLLRFRPDVREAEAAFAQAFYATQAARSAFYPRITLGGTFGWTNGSGLNVANPGSWLLNTLGSLVAPLFNRGTNRAGLKIAQAQQEEALLLFRQRLLDAGTEVNNALLEWQTARKKAEVDTSQILYLQAAVRNTRSLMKNGSASYLEVLTSQQNLLQAELDGTTDKYAQLQSIITLYQALGGGSM